MKKFEIRLEVEGAMTSTPAIVESENIQKCAYAASKLLAGMFHSYANNNNLADEQMPKELAYTIRINEVVPKVEPTYYQVTDPFDTEIGQVFKQAGNYVDEEGKVIGVALVDKDDEPMFYIFEQVTMVTLPY